MILYNIGNIRGRTLWQFLDNTIVCYYDITKTLTITKITYPTFNQMNQLLMTPDLTILKPNQAFTGHVVLIWCTP